MNRATDRLQREQPSRPHAREGVSYRVGKLAYEAYCSACGGRDFNTGAQLLPWANLEQDVREAWHAAADSVWNDCVALYFSRGGAL